MQNVKFNKADYDNSWFDPGPLYKRILWYFCNALFFLNPLFPFRGIKPGILRLFGAKIGKRCIIQPRVNIKYPWFLDFGDYVSIGERVWIDSLARVKLHDQVTISQDTILFTGNHSYKSPSFALSLDGVEIGEGAWIGARCVIAAGITIGPYAMLTMGSIATKDCDAYTIYRGNPAQKFKTRVIEE